MSDRHKQFDVIVIGSGTGGATVARELARGGTKVLLLEQGGHKPLKESLGGIGAVAREIAVGEGLKATTAATVGGATAVYFGVCKLPTQSTYDKVGIDFSAELEEVLGELPVAELPDAFLPPQSIRVRDSAARLGYHFKKNLMLVDQTRCADGMYSYQAKWKSRSYVDDAVSAGATLLSGTAVERIVVQGGRAVGVEYRTRKGFGATRGTAYAGKIVVSAGALDTPRLLMQCGLEGIGNRGFFFKPGFMVCGTVSDLRGRDGFIGCLDTDLGDGISIGDGTMHAPLFKLLMLSNGKLKHLLAHPRMVSVGVLMSDEMGGEIRPDGRYHKQLSGGQLARLRAAEEVAAGILGKAGARGIFSTRLAAGLPGGALRVHEHLDQDLRTGIDNLYVCDHSLLSDEKITPTIPLICLGRRLARHLTSTL